VEHLDEVFGGDGFGGWIATGEHGVLRAGGWCGSGFGELDLGAFAVELGDAEAFAEEAELAGAKEIKDGLGGRAVAVY
jgi:hypothetical protein